MIYGGGISLDQTKSLKAITALYIVLGHIGRVIEQPGWFRTVNSFGWIDVGIFFFISGYGLAFGYHNKPDYFKTFKKRIGSVLIPFLVAHLVYMAGDLLFGVPYGMAEILRSLIGQSTLVRNDWYVPTCLLFYMLFWAIYNCDLREQVKLMMLAFSVCIYVCVCSFALKLGSFWWMNALPFFGGVWWQSICHRERKENNRKSVWLRRVFVCVAGYTAAYIAVPLSNRILGTYEYEICYNLMSLFGVGFIILMFSAVGKGNRITGFIAAISYEIYLYHGLFIDGFRSEKFYKMMCCMCFRSILQQ